MKKVKNKRKDKRRNPVSKYMHQFNKSAVFRDRKYDYKRKPKNKKEQDQL